MKLLIETIDEAATHVHETTIRLRPPKKYPAPYGGRLVWTLPGKTKMVAHLKDKSKIRHRKRWSQVRVVFAVSVGTILNAFYFNFTLVI